MIKVIVLLEVKDPKALQLFERQAVKIMKKYEGKLVVAFEPDANESSSSNIAEIHYLQFPSIDAFKKYRADPQHLELSELRKKAISNITIFVSGNTKDYEQKDVTGTE